MKHLLVACGGTGGHFYPTLAIAKAFCALGNRVTLLVAGMHADEQLKTAKENGIDAVRVSAVRGPSSLVSALLFPFRMFSCVMEARRCIKAAKPDVMLGMGSYASFPACLGKPSRIPLVLHEGNAFMGKTNRMMAGKARAIGLSLPLVDDSQLKGARGVVVGMPLRENVVKAAENPQKDDAYLESLGLKPGVPTLLVFGGSQGARRLNEILAESAPLLAKRAGQLQLIHLTGTDDNQALVDAYAKAGLRASVRKADYSIEKCYVNADLVICRGGASTLCELALFGKPAVIIPLPTAADDHQTVNARMAEKLGGARHLPQSHATPEVLSAIADELLDHPEHFRAMGEKIRALAKTDSAQAMAKLILETLEK